MALLPQLRHRNGELSPRSSFDMLQQQIDRLFDDFTTGWRMPGLIQGSDFGLMPSMDMHEEDNRMVVTAELPGVDEKDVDIEAQGQMLTISGEKRSMIDDTKGSQRHSERMYGRFSRTVTLPFDIDPSKVDARFDKGVLTLSINKPAEAQTRQRKIPIKH